MHRFIAPYWLLSTCLCLAPLVAEEDPHAIRFENVKTSRWRFGVEISARGGAVSGIVATLPVPMDWPEQKVKLLNESISPRSAKVSFRVLEEGVKQMVVTIPKLADGEEASIVFTYEIEKAWIEAPTSTAELRAPKNARSLSKFLTASPYIETNDAAIRRQASELVNSELEAWKQTEAFFTWVRANIKYKFAEEIKPAPDALRDREGDCEELSSLFIAFCRNQKIPARAVWIPGHTYPEFYLEDQSGHGHWYPCQAAGEAPDFGRMPEDRPILQKGDNFKLPDDKKPQRYVKQSLTARNAVAAPQVKFIMAPVVEK